MIMRARIFLIMAMAAMLAGCNTGAPAGQVIARVDGTEITRRELLGEMEAEGVSPDADLAAVQGPLVERLVNRTLLVRAAEKALVDRTPAFQAAVYRNRQMLLAQAYTDRLMQDVAQPEAAEIAAFIAANPQMFAQRRVLLLDRVTVAGAAPLPPAVSRARTMDEVVEALKAEGTGFNRAQVMEDTRAMDGARASALTAATPGRPAIGQIQGLSWIEASVTAWPVPSANEDFDAVARATLLARRQAAAADQLMAGLRRQAVIDYQPGFDPAAKGDGVKAAR